MSFCRVLLRKRPILLRSLLIVATPYDEFELLAYSVKKELPMHLTILESSHSLRVSLFEELPIPCSGFKKLKLCFRRAERKKFTYFRASMRLSNNCIRRVKFVQERWSEVVKLKYERKEFIKNKTPR